jgi:hypothetical protein
MKFVKGTPKPANSGRQVGTPNKRTVAFYERIKDLGFDAAEEMVKIHSEAIRSLDFCNREERLMYLGIALKAAAEIAQYCYPKQKAVEVKRENHLEGMSPQEKLEAMKAAVKLLENEMEPSDES